MAYKFEPAKAGEEQIDWVLYDSQVIDSSTASTTGVLFDQAESAATNTYQDTNMSQAGQLPTTQRMKVDEISIFLDDVALELATSQDSAKFLDQASLEIKVNQKRMFICPLRLLIARGSQFGGPVAAGASATGVVGFSYILKNPLVIPGGVSFEVKLTSGLSTTTATTAATQVCLIGELVRPSV